MAEEEKADNPLKDILARLDRIEESFDRLIGYLIGKFGDEELEGGSAE